MKVNGNDVRVDAPVTLAEFIVSNNYNIDRVAVELNGKIVPKRSYNDVQIGNGDTLEIVGFVGGG
ncbi:MAG: sulfur carrier protein ThiS [Candidatus Methanoplasma sp.]|jgi:thiamine biosynthesis protein ThiS|nr:sulfur carrier protein ThiS [Candidatus Methanoplasma sp.]